LAKAIAGFSVNKKAEDIVILDMRKMVNFCDYFVICTGNSTRQVRAIADGIEDGLQKAGLGGQQTQTDKFSRWILVDLGDVVAHIFERETRDFYGLEYLWQAAPRIGWNK
jgi:ribosome-associated protein